MLGCFGVGEFDSRRVKTATLRSISIWLLAERPEREKKKSVSFGRDGELLTEAARVRRFFLTIEPEVRYPISCVDCLHTFHTRVLYSMAHQYSTLPHFSQLMLCVILPS